MPLYVRPVQPQDEQFIYQLTYQTLFEQLRAELWNPAIRDQLLDLQIRVKYDTYAFIWPQADHAIIMLDDERVGRMIINRAGEHYRLVDITVAPKHRGSGIGTRLTLALCTEAAMMGKSVRLNVSVTNPRAAALYKRLGFRVIEDLETDWIMERAPADQTQVIASP